jgi:hypothetical protein
MPPRYQRVVYVRGADGWRIAIDAPWGLPPSER